MNIDCAVKELVADQKLITATEETTVDEALRLMTDHKITSLPVLKKPEGSNGKKEIVGFVDALDLVGYLLQVSGRTITSPITGESHSLESDDLVQLRVRAKHFSLTQVKDAIDLSERNPLLYLKEDVTVRQVITSFWASAHRLAVVDRQYNLIGLLTQSQLIRFLDKHLDELPDLSKEKVSDIVYTPVNTIASVQKNVWAIQAFAKMHQARLSSLAVVDSTGLIVDNLSATDLRGVLIDFRALLSPVHEFLEKSRNVAKITTRALITCELKSTLPEVLRQITQTGVHRVYVIDSQERPVGVLSLTDILYHTQQVVGRSQ